MPDPQTTKRKAKKISHTEYEAFLLAKRFPVDVVGSDKDGVLILEEQCLNQ